MTVTIDVGESMSVVLDDDDARVLAEALRDLDHVAFADAVEEALGGGAAGSLLIFDPRTRAPSSRR